MYTCIFAIFQVCIFALFHSCIFALRYILPVESNVQKLVHVFYTQPSFIAPYAKVNKYCDNKTSLKIGITVMTMAMTILQLVQWAEAILVERDIRVWNSKRLFF